ncbi:MAG: rRNA maturation RNase YbeY [Thermoanaerobaculia bacterium]
MRNRHESPRVDIEIALQNPLHYPGLDLRRLRRWLMPVIAELVSTVAVGSTLIPDPSPLTPGRVGLTVRFVSDRQIRDLNRNYRGLDRATDVLSFQGAATPDGQHLGDLVIGVPTARRQAQRLGHTLSRELKELVLHGLLHLLGHDHERDEGVMDALELELCRRWIDDDHA